MLGGLARLNREGGELTVNTPFAKRCSVNGFVPERACIASTCIRAFDFKTYQHPFQSHVGAKNKPASL